MNEPRNEQIDEQLQRIESLVGASDDLDYRAAAHKFCEHLRQHLVLPCEVTGIEDFNWEEYYVIGPGSRKEYDQLWQTQPSYQDNYDLKSIEFGPVSRWMLFGASDIAAHVRRNADGKKFVLGLSEPRATDENSLNHRLLDDFATFVANYR